jgi:hypothetical protein
VARVQGPDGAIWTAAGILLAFVVYWLGRCTLFPLWAVGIRGSLASPVSSRQLLSNAPARTKAWARRIPNVYEIPVLAAPSGVRKEDVVEPYYRRLRKSQGVACVLTSLEQGRTFRSYPLHRNPTSGDANHRLIKTYRKRFLHHYWYTNSSTGAAKPGLGRHRRRRSTST